MCYFYFYFLAVINNAPVKSSVKVSIGVSF